MKGAWWEKFSHKYLLPELPGFAVKGKLLFRTPVGPLLRAILFDSSAFSRAAFYPQCFVQALFVPLDHLSLTFGERFRGAWHVEGSEPDVARKLLKAIREIGLPFLNALDTPSHLAHPQTHWEASSNPHVQQAIAYALAFEGEQELAIARLTRLRLSMLSHSDRAPWEDALIADLERFSGILSRDPLAATDALQRWTQETRTKLKLPN